MRKKFFEDLISGLKDEDLKKVINELNNQLCYNIIGGIMRKILITITNFIIFTAILIFVIVLSIKQITVDTLYNTMLTQKIRQSITQFNSNIDFCKIINTIIPIIIIKHKIIFIKELFKKLYNLIICFYLSD